MSGKLKNIKQDVRREIGKRIIDARNKAGILGDRPLMRAMENAGYPVSPSTLGNILSGISSPRVEIWIGLSKVLNVSLDYLILGKEPEKQDLVDQETLEQIKKAILLQEKPKSKIVSDIMNITGELSEKKQKGLLAIAESLHDDDNQ